MRIEREIGRQWLWTDAAKIINQILVNYLETVYSKLNSIPMKKNNNILALKSQPAIKDER